MILFELTKDEAHPAYAELAISNGDRQYSFLRSIVDAALQMRKPFLSQQILKALNYHAITCLHINAGEYRPCPVAVGTHRPPEHYRVPALMDDFVNVINRRWEVEDALVLATRVLWQLNYIHPFINGNGRTARAACYFVLCVKSGGWIKGAPILPDLIKSNRPDYVKALSLIDASLPRNNGEPDLTPLHAILSDLLNQQLSQKTP